MPKQTKKFPRRRGANPYNIQRGSPGLKGQGVGPERRPAVTLGSRSDPILHIRDLPLFGLRTRRRLPYNEQISFAGGVSTVTSYLFSVNGIFDPNISGTGHQPMGFDQMMIFYNHYTVLRATLRAIFRSTSNNTAEVGMMVSGSTTVSSDLRVILENGSCVYTMITPSGISGSVVELTIECDSAAFQGLSTQSIMADGDMRGDASSNPLEQMYFVLFNTDSATANAPSQLVSVNIEYDVVFHEPRKGTLS